MEVCRSFAEYAIKTAHVILRSTLWESKAPGIPESGADEDGNAHHEFDSFLLIKFTKYTEFCMLRCRPGSTLFPRRSTRRTPATWCASACHADSLSCLPTSVHTISPQSAESVRAATCAGVDTRSMSAAVDACSVRCCLVATPPAHDAARSPALATNSFTAVAFQHDVLCNAVTLRSLSAHTARNKTQLALVSAFQWVKPCSAFQFISPAHAIGRL